MDKLTKRPELRKAIVLGYREVIRARYQYKNLKKKYRLPASFDERRVDLLRNYFLEYIYPPPEQRIRINKAFDSLDEYIRHPGKFLRLLMDSASLLFKYGRHLPKILSSGLKALSSFHAAIDFEQKLVLQAERLGWSPPFSIDQINDLLRALPREDLELFINNGQVLFETLQDRTLVKKILEIIDFLIHKMKQKPDVYSAVEIDGLELGKSIIARGDFLFHELDNKSQHQIFESIVEIERDVLKVLFD